MLRLVTRRPKLRTDTHTLPLPAALSVGHREVDISAHRINVSSRWWQNHLDSRGLPGGPLPVQRDGAKEFLTRADVWSRADRLKRDEDVLSLLWHALAWGAGTRGVRNDERRMDAIAAGRGRAVTLLRQAALLSHTSPEQAYQMLHPGGKGAISQLGPAFGTKFLYFAGGGRPEHPCLILDKRVATALAANGWLTLGAKGGWYPGTYGEYCTLARRWAGEQQQVQGAPVAADQVEKWLFLAS